MLNVHDTYGLNIVQQVAEIPPGYFFGTNVIGPMGVTEMDENSYELFVAFNEDGSAAIVNSQVLASDTDEDACITTPTILPLDDDMIYQI